MEDFGSELSRTSSMWKRKKFVQKNDVKNMSKIYGSSWGCSIPCSLGTT